MRNEIEAHAAVVGVLSKQDVLHIADGKYVMYFAAEGGQPVKGKRHSVRYGAVAGGNVTLFTSRRKRPIDIVFLPYHLDDSHYRKARFIATRNGVPLYVYHAT